jgi:hypothetical protein
MRPIIALFFLTEATVLPNLAQSPYPKSLESLVARGEKLERRSKDLAAQKGKLSNDRTALQREHAQLDAQHDRILQAQAKLEDSLKPKVAVIDQDVQAFQNSDVAKSNGSWQRHWPGHFQQVMNSQPAYQPIAKKYLDHFKVTGELFVQCPPWIDPNRGLLRGQRPTDRNVFWAHLANDTNTAHRKYTEAMRDFELRRQNIISTGDSERKLLKQRSDANDQHRAEWQKQKVALDESARRLESDFTRLEKQLAELEKDRAEAIANLTQARDSASRVDSALGLIGRGAWLASIVTGNRRFADAAEVAKKLRDPVSQLDSMLDRVNKAVNQEDAKKESRSFFDKLKVLTLGGQTEQLQKIANAVREIPIGLIGDDLDPSFQVTPDLLLKNPKEAEIRFGNLLAAMGRNFTYLMARQVELEELERYCGAASKAFRDLNLKIEKAVGSGVFTNQMVAIYLDADNLSRAYSDVASSAVLKARDARAAAQEQQRRYENFRLSAWTFFGMRLGGELRPPNVAGPSPTPIPGASRPNIPGTNRPRIPDPVGP